jgi:hypothetical protein
LVPAIRKRFGMDMSDEAVATMLMANFNRGTSDFMGEYIVNALKFKKDAAIFQNTKGLGEAYKHYLKSPEGAEIAAAEGWHNLLTVIGSVYLPSITSGLLSLAGSLTRLSDWTESHPNVTKALVYSFATLAGTMTFGGTVILLSAAFRGLGLALMFQAAGGAARLSTAIAALSSPIGIAVLALGTLAAAAYAFRPFTKDEVNAQRKDGAHLTAGAKERAKALGWDPEEKLTQDAVRLKNLTDSSVVSNIARHGPVMGITHYLADKARLAFGTPPVIAGGQQRPVVVRSGSNDRPAAAPAPYATSRPQPVQVVSNTYLDGRLISQSVVERMAQESMRPAAGLSGVDPRMGYMSPSMVR